MNTKTTKNENKMDINMPKKVNRKTNSSQKAFNIVEYFYTHMYGVWTHKKQKQNTH